MIASLTNNLMTSTLIYKFIFLIITLEHLLNLVVAVFLCATEQLDHGIYIANNLNYALTF